MTKNSKLEDELPGNVSSDEINEISIEKWLTRDIGVCLTLLKAIYDDPNCRRELAKYLAGVHRNRVQHNAAMKNGIDNPVIPN